MFALEAVAAVKVAAENKGVLESLGIDLPLLIFNLINFGILMYLLQRFFFKPIMATIAERKHIIEEGVAKAAESEALLASSKAQREAEIQAGRKAAQTIIDDSKELAQNQSLKIRYDAEKQAESIVSNAYQTALSDKNQLLEEAKLETKNMVVMATKKLIDKTVSANDAELELSTLVKPTK
jgi:F-type H+-transporting ATPase subunit b